MPPTKGKGKMIPLGMFRGTLAGAIVAAVVGMVAFGLWADDLQVISTRSRRGRPETRPP